MYSIEEITLMKMYSGLSLDRLTVINNLKKILSDIEEEEAKLLAKDTIRKLTALTNEEFASIDFSVALDSSDMM